VSVVVAQYGAKCGSPLARANRTAVLCRARGAQHAFGAGTRVEPRRQGFTNGQLQADSPTQGEHFCKGRDVPCRNQSGGRF
jgi:hypothetical protein